MGIKDESSIRYLIENSDAEEQAARTYASEADRNPIDEFTPTQKLLMRAAFLAGIAWQKNRLL